MGIKDGLNLQNEEIYSFLMIGQSNMAGRGEIGDVAIFKELGYTPDEVIPVDLFPRTGHCEAVVLLTRKEQI